MTDCGVTCGACPLAGLCGDPVPPARPLSADVARLAADVTALAEARWDDLVGEPTPKPDWGVLIDAYLKAELAKIGVAYDPETGDMTDVDPDAPDVDPAEPKPEGVGCCGGACSR